jgi:hypothetical protein
LGQLRLFALRKDNNLFRHLTTVQLWQKRTGDTIQLVMSIKIKTGHSGLCIFGKLQNMKIAARRLADHVELVRERGCEGRKKVPAPLPNINPSSTSQ